MMFYKETNFKETPIGKITEDWSITKLNNLIEIEAGKRAKGGALDEGNVASIGGEHIDDEGNIRWDDMKFIPEDLYHFLKQGKVNLGDILLVKDGATTGKVAIVKNLKYEKVAVNEHVFVIRSKTDRLINEFLFYFLFSKFGQIQIKTRFHGMIGGIIRNDLETILAPLPSHLEQQKIAEILSTVDEAIQKTNEIIAKTERLKKGLMQTLLTRGIGHKEYKQTPIGTIPKTWQVTTTSDVTLFIKDGTHTPPRRVENGIPLFSAQNIVDGKIVRTNEDTYITEEEYWKIHTKYEIQKNDVLLTIVGTIGNTAIVDVDYRFTLQRSVAIFRPDTEKIEPRFLHYAFQSDSFKRQLLGHSKLTTQGGVYLKELSSLMIPVPPFEEQYKITNILSSIDAKLELEKKEKVRLERIKHGLMDLLLTGKIRIKVN